MHRPRNTHPQDGDHNPAPGDSLETLTGSMSMPPDSPSSAADAGLIDRIDFDAPLADEPRLIPEIPISDLAIDPPQLHSPEMGDHNAPGEIDIEELDDAVIEEALPPDARLDPIEP